MLFLVRKSFDNIAFGCMHTIVFDCRNPFNKFCVDISHLVFFCLNCLHSLHDVLSGIFQFGSTRSNSTAVILKQYVLKSDRSQSRHVCYHNTLITIIE